MIRVARSGASARTTNTMAPSGMRAATSGDVRRRDERDLEPAEREARPGQAWDRAAGRPDRAPGGGACTPSRPGRRAAGSAIVALRDPALRDVRRDPLREHLVVPRRVRRGPGVADVVERDARLVERRRAPERDRGLDERHAVERVEPEARIGVAPGALAERRGRVRRADERAGGGDRAGAASGRPASARATPATTDAPTGRRGEREGGGQRGEHSPSVDGAPRRPQACAQTRRTSAARRTLRSFRFSEPRRDAGPGRAATGMGKPRVPVPGRARRAISGPAAKLRRTAAGPWVARSASGIPPW